MTDPQVKVSLKLDSKQYEQALKSASKHTDAVDESMKKTQKTAGRVKADWTAMGAAITVAGGVAVVALKKAVDAASSLNESTTKMKVIFGSASKDIEAFASTSATSLGISKRAAYDAASMMATFGKAAGLTGKELSSFSTEMVSLSSDLASFYDSSPEDAMEAIGAALRGESEPIRRYGVLLDDATLRNRALEMGIISNIKNALTPQQKALAAQAEVLAQTSDAQGDFERTSDGLANSQRSMQGAMEDASAALGESLLPVMTKGVKAVAAVAEAFSGLPGPVRDTAAGLALTAAAVATLGPATVGAVKGVKGMAKGLQGYTVATNGATTASVGLRGAMAGLAAPIGAVALALVGVGAAAVVFQRQTAARVDELSQSMLDAAASGRELDSVMSHTPKRFGEAMHGIEDYVRALDGGNLAVGQTVEGFKSLDAALVAMNPDDAARAHDKLADRVKAAGLSVEDLNAQLPQYIALQKDAAQAAGYQTTEEKDKAEAIKASNDAQQKAIDLVTNYINAQLAAAGSADYLRGAKDRLVKAAKDNTTSLNKETSAGRENRDAIRSEISAVLANANAKIEQAKAAGKTTVEAYAIGNKAIEKGRVNLEAAAKAAGYNEKEVKRLLDRYMELPKDVKTQVEATGVTAAQNAASAYKRLLGEIPSRVTTQILAVTRKINAGGTGVPMATGGKITGPGTGTSDSIPAMLSDGEWVIPAKVGDRLGDDFMSRLVDGDVEGFATGGKVSKAPTAAQRKAAAAKRKREAEAARKKRAAAAKAKREAALADIEWQYQMDLISLPQKIAAMQKQLKSRKKGSQEAKDLQLDIHRDQKSYRGDQERDAAEELEKAAQAQQKAAADQQSAADTLKSKADGIASAITGALSLSQTQANGKKWSATAMLGDFANRAKQARDFASMVAQLSGRGLSEEVINQVLSAGPVAGADMARALTRMSAGQLATVNQNQGAINAAGQWLGNQLTYGNNNAVTVTLSGGAPVVLQLDSRAIYEAQLVLRRQMGGSYALSG